jgi:hypothetical protein
MARGSGDGISMKIFLWFIFIAVALFLAFWLYSVYDQYVKSGSIENDTQGTLDCGGYIFAVTDIGYDGSTLTFTLQNGQIGAPIQVIDIKSESGTVERKVGNLAGGMEVRVTVPDFPIRSDFVVYPKDCLRFNSKEFRMVNGTWQALD